MDPPAFSAPWMSILTSPSLRVKGLNMSPVGRNALFSVRLARRSIPWVATMLAVDAMVILDFPSALYRPTSISTEFSSLRSSSTMPCSISATGMSVTVELISTLLPLTWPEIVISSPDSSRLKPGATSLLTVRLSPPSATMLVSSSPPVGRVRFEV